MGRVLSVASVEHHLKVVLLLRVDLFLKMKFWAFLTLLLVVIELDQSEAFLKKLFKKDKKDDKKCEVRWEEHTQPHCTTTYDKKCEQEYKDECSTEYATECWEEQEQVCSSHPECSTQHEQKCSTTYQRVCQDGGKKGKKGKGKFKREAVEYAPEEEAAIEEIKTMSAGELLELAQDVAISEDLDEKVQLGDASPHKRKKRVAGIIALKLIKKYLKYGDDDYDEDCHDVPHQQGASVPVERCHDVKKCHNKPTTKCQKTPHQKCWQEPHEVCQDVPHQKCWQEPHENCWEVPNEKCWEEPHQKCWQVPHEKCVQVAHDRCWEVPQEHCDYVKVKVAKKWCLEKDKKNKNKKGDKWDKKIWKKLEKLIGKGKTSGGYDDDHY